ncbi:MAG: hypothetical protein WDO73_09720 [Ignavibacteriota bacterium]
MGGRLARRQHSVHAAKWAVGGFTESLAKEVAPFGVKVCALEPEGCGRIGVLGRIEILRACFQTTIRPWGSGEGAAALLGARNERSGESRPGDSAVAGQRESPSSPANWQ